MILQIISILISKLITIIILLLNQIGQEQIEYIIKIGSRFYLLNTEIINKKILINIQHKKYIHILISPELIISNKFHNTATCLMFKKQLNLIIMNETYLILE